ncbi:MAG: hypothetical protein ACPGJW_09790, partial [Paracoccaceae bacterium]
MATSSIVMQSVQWSKLDDIDDIAPVNNSDYQVLNELRDVLIKHGYSERFGICLLHKHFDIAEGEIAVEHTDVEARVSTVTVQDNAPSRDDNMIET